MTRREAEKLAYRSKSWRACYVTNLHGVSASVRRLDDDLYAVLYEPLHDRWGERRSTLPDKRKLVT